jgi:Fe-S cluster assembly iron-binding protein IscA
MVGVRRRTGWDSRRLGQKAVAGTRAATERKGSTVLTITPGAEEALAVLRDSVEDLPENGGVRITQEADQEGSPAFSLQLVEEAEDDDVVLDGHALPVFVEPTAAELLDGTALDGEAHGDHVHFGFVAVGEEGDFGHGGPSQNGSAPTA